MAGELRKGRPEGGGLLHVEADRLGSLAEVERLGIERGGGLGAAVGDDLRVASVAIFLIVWVAPPVPAGISRPTMTFSLRPTSRSRLPCVAASVSTRVVSRNEAAEMKDRVCRLALVTPKRIGAPFAGSRPEAIALSFSLSKGEET